MRIFRNVRNMLDFRDLDDDVTLRKEGGVLVGDTGGGGGAADASELPFDPAGTIAATNTQAAVEEVATDAASALSTHSADTTAVHGITDTSALLDTGDIGSSVAAQSHQHAGEDITSGTVADARIASTIARDSEVAAAVAAHEADTTSVHGIADTSLLALAANVQPLDSDLTAIAALTTTSFGRGLLELANAAALLAAAGAQASDSDLTAIAGLSPSNDDVVQRKGGAWTNRTIAQLLADLAAAGTTFQPLDSDLTALAALATNAAGRSALVLTDPNADRIAFWDDSAGAFTWLQLGTNLSITNTTLDAAGGSALHDAYALLRDEKSAGTQSGTFTQAAWRTRTLNTEKFDPDGIVSLASNQFTLAAGTYLIRGRGAAFGVDRHQLKIRNITDSTDDIIGSSQYASAADGVNNDSVVVGRITIAGSKTFELQHICATTRSNQGFGVEANAGVTEVYAEVEIWREAA